MSAAFAGSDFGDEQESQLTLGTTSLLSIFFGLVMVCGVFFGLGYSVGRRGFAQAANLGKASTPVPAKSIAPAPPAGAGVPVLNAQVKPPAPPPSASPEQKVAGASPAVTPVSTRPAAQTAAVKSTTAAPVLTAESKAPVPVSTLLEKKQFLPKPSAIHPVLVQPHTNLPYVAGVSMPPNPYQSAPAPWHWTPPFDVHHDNPVHAKPVRLRTPRLLVANANAGSGDAALIETKALPSTHTALTVHIAALSREDDAQVLADALRKRGFIASIHNETDDSLYHVEVGPFERRTALATQQRLIAKGYNAVLK